MNSRQELFDTVARRLTPDQPGLKLHALDAEDLALVSAHLQDALVRVGDLTFLPQKRRFAFVASRFDWEAEAGGRLERVRTCLHFEGVKKARCQRVARDRPDAILALLALVFEPGVEAPDGRVRLIFAGGADILLEVECVEAQLTDIGPRWSVGARPRHQLDEDAR
jgi:hypothetical protein